jgi:hypothetical protein
LKTELVSKLANFNATNYSDNEDFSNDENITDGYIDNGYLKKETKLYKREVTYDSNGSAIVSYNWYGDYEYNRQIDGVQVQEFMGAPTGELIHYYKKDIIVDANSNPKLTNSILYGSNGSDVIIGNKDVYGQNLNSTENQNHDDVPNGNDILIGETVTAYKGDNLLYGKDAINGGSGSDIMISDSATVRINHQSIDGFDKESTVLIKNGIVYTSTGKAKIMADEGATVHSLYGQTIFSAGSMSNTFIGDESSLEKITFLSDGHPLINNSAVSRKAFNKLNVSSLGPNYIFGGQETSFMTAYLADGDFLNMNSAQGNIYCSGNNQVELNSGSTLYSEGNSNITVSGSNNRVYLGAGDYYDISKSSNGKYFPQGYLTDNESNSEYTINGYNNSFYVGSFSYNLLLNGSNNNIYITEYSSEETSVNIRENGLNNFIFEANYSSLLIDTDSNTLIKGKDYESFLLEGLTFKGVNDNSLIINQLNISNIDIVSEGDVEIVAPEPVVRSKIINIKTLGNIKFQYFYGDNVKLETNQDIMVTGSRYPYNNGDFNVSTEGVFNKMDFDSLRASNLTIASKNSSTIVSGRITVNKEVNIKNATFDLKIEGSEKVILTGDGKVDIDGINDVTDINIEGDLSEGIFKNFKNLYYNQINDVLSKITINDSLNINKISGFKNAEIILDKGNISEIDLEGSFYEIRTGSEIINIDKLKIKSKDFIFASNNNLINNLDLDINDFYIKAENCNVANINIGNDLGVYIKSASVLSINSKSKSSFLLNIDSVNELIIEGGFINLNGLGITIDKLEVNLDFSTLSNYELIFRASKNLIINSSLVKMKRQNYEYLFNSLLTSRLPDELNINGKIYTLKEIQDINNTLLATEGYPYAILSSTGVEYLQEPNEEYIFGTDGDDVIYGNADGISRIYPRKGMDIINIVGGNTIINYSVGDGYKVIVNPNNIQVGIVIEGVVDRSLLTYVQTDPKTLHVSYNNDLLFTWNNAAYCYLQFSGTTDFVYGSSILNNIPPINPTEPTNPENPNPPTGPTNPTDPSNPTNPTNPTNPPSNVYSGTAGNDYQTLSENVAYTINSSAGNDTYEFTMGNGNNNVLNYAIGSGLTTIKTSGNNFIFLNIKFSNIDKSLLSFSILRNQLGNESELTISYNKIAIIKINNYVNVGLLINITNNGESITMNNTDIEASLYNINGTDSDDNLIGNTTNSIFNPGKGTDLINIIGGSNRINYKAGDGYKTVINPTFSYVMVVFDSSIDKKLIKYALGDNNSLNIKYNNELIFTLKQPNAAGIQFSDYSIVNGYEILQGLSTINGTDADEIIEGNASGPSIINPKKGTDIINLIGGQNTINYFIGDGYKTINSTGLYYQININGEIDNLLLSYVKNGDEAIDVKYNDEIIFSISDPYSATIALTSTNQYIYLSQVYDELSAIQGTDGDDILYGAENGSYIIGKKGNDEINLVGGYNTIGYAIGDGHDTIKGEYSNMIRLSGVVDRELLTFEKVDTHMNVYYDTEVILTIEYPYMSNIQIEETYEFINLSDYMTDE